MELYIFPSVEYQRAIRSRPQVTFFGEEMFLKVFAAWLREVWGRSAAKLVMFLNIQSLKEVIMEMAILVIGVGAAALWFFLTKDKPTDKTGHHET